MLRLTVRLTDDRDDVRDCAQTLLDVAPGDIRVVAVFVEGKSVEAYLEIEDGVDDRRIDQWIAGFGFEHYELSDVELMPVRPEPGVVADVDPPTWPASVATITRVVAEPADDTLRIQVRHRRYETIQRIDVEETDHVVRVKVMVGVPHDDPHAPYVSFAVIFSWVRARLRRPLGSRRVTWDGAAPAAPVAPVETAGPAEPNADKTGGSPALAGALAPAPQPDPPPRKVWKEWK
jgi:hypothetical protein